MKRVATVLLALMLLGSFAYVAHAGFDFGLPSAIKKKVEKLDKKVEEANHVPNIPSSPTPSDGATNQSVDVDLSWTGGDPDTGDTVVYDVYFEKNDSTPDVLVSDDQSGTTYNLGTLEYNTHYYWQIIVKDNQGSITPGPVWNFKAMKQVVYKTYGLNFGPYTKEGQNPDWGTIIPESQIRELLTIIAPYTNWIRTFGCTSGLENVGRIAHEMGLKVAVGAWLGKDSSTNNQQISSLINIAKAGEADLLIVGSEVLLRNDLTESQLIGYINQVKQAVPGISVTTDDVYSEFLHHQAVIDAIDVVLVNYYPCWEGIVVKKEDYYAYYAVYYLNLCHQKLMTVVKDKPIIVGETGWPSAGNKLGNAVPSSENASFYWLNFISWARAKNVSYFYFEAFDEPWKTESTWGPHWGVWDKDSKLKSGMQDVFDGKTMADNWTPSNPSIEFTYVPPYGSFDNLKGQVWGVWSDDYKVAVYIYVNGWWTKPYWNSPLTTIKNDGSWVCDITTGGVDQNATKIAAFLIPNGYNPPKMSGGQTLPAELYQYPYVQVSR